jgi:hypothetical protein
MRVTRFIEIGTFATASSGFHRLRDRRTQSRGGTT